MGMVFAEKDRHVKAIICTPHRRKNCKKMLQLFNSNNPVQRYVLTMPIVFSLVLMAMPFTAGAQESDIDREAFEEKLASCVYEWDCFDNADFQKETVLVNLNGLKCPEEESGVGWVILSGRKGSEQSGSFNIDGLEYRLLFGDGALEYYLFIVEADGTGLYYDFSDIKEGESAKPSQIFACVDRSEEAINRMIKTFGF